MNYFLKFDQKNVFDKKNHVVEFIRNYADKKVLSNAQKLLNESTDRLSIIDFIPNGDINLSTECVESVFSNNAVGGGVLGYSADQEEIKYLTCPECLVILLLAYEPQFKQSGNVDYFQRSLLDNESFCINGAEIYSECSGYGDTFKFLDPYDDTREMNGMMRGSKILIFDATNNRQFMDSVKKKNLLKLISSFNYVEQINRKREMSSYW